MYADLNFEAKNKPLGEVLFSHRKFRVPRYQRPYAWDIEQVSEFWEDLISSEEPYFLGSFIFNTESQNDDGYVDIIDGQQRLLTTTILSAALRDHAKNLDPPKAALYQRQDIAIEDREGRQAFRILPADTLVSFFSKYIQNPDGDILKSIPKTPEETRVKKIYEYLYEKVAGELRRFEGREGQLDNLEKIRKKIAKLVVISVEIGREEDAYEIFETTNARGLELSVADLLKNLIFKKIEPGDNRDLAKDIWQEITNDIEATSTELKKFIRYFWVSKYAFVTEKKLYREIKNKITDWQGLLNDLWEASSWYDKLLEGEEADFQDLKHGHKIHDAVFALRLMRVSQCYVLLLAILRNYNRLGTDPTRIFQLLERFTFQYSVVCKLPGNRVEKIYSRYATKLEETARGGPSEKVSQKIQSLFSQLEGELKAEAPSENLFKELFQDLSYRNSEEGRRLTKYILSSLDRYFRSTDEHKINFSTVNIEHILPQNPHDEWNLKKKEIKPYVNLLGNLTLLSKKLNSKAQNAPIEKKLPELQKSDLAITKELVSQLGKLNYKWGKSEIQTRQREYADLAYNQIWKL